MRKRGHWTYAGVAAVGALVLGAPVAACSTPPDPPAGLELVVSTNLGAPTDYDAIRVQVSQQTVPGTWNQLFDYAFMMPGGATLPATLAIAPGPGTDQDALIKVTAYQGYESDSNPGMVRVLREAQVQIPTTRVAELDLELVRVCVNVVCTNPDQSCQPDTGDCGSNTVQTSSLATYTGSPTSSLEAGAGCEGTECDASSPDVGPRADSGTDATTHHDATAGNDAARETGGAGDDSGRDGDDVGDADDASDGGGDDVGDADDVHDAHDRDAHEAGHADAGNHEDSGDEHHDAGRDAGHDGPVPAKDSGAHAPESGIDP